MTTLHKIKKQAPRFYYKNFPQWFGRVSKRKSRRIQRDRSGRYKWYEEAPIYRYLKEAERHATALLHTKYPDMKDILDRRIEWLITGQ